MYYHKECSITATSGGCIAGCYRYHTPYLWSFSNQYTSGKFVQDGVFDPNAISKQCGAAVILSQMVRNGLVTFPATAAAPQG